MRIITIHADYVEVTAKQQAIKAAEAPPKEPQRMDDCLVVFSAVEKRDEPDPTGVARRLAKEVADVCQQVKAGKVLLYPYVHLTSSPGAPATALEVLKQAEELLAKQGLEVKRAPFGWYKAFTLKAKGHPLSELSREFTAEAAPAAGEKQEESKALAAEKKLASTWHIIDLDGHLHPLQKQGNALTGYDFTRWPRLLKLAKYEIAKDRAAHQEPAHVRLMQKLELVDHEPASDPGNLRYYPKGRLIKALLEAWVAQQMSAYGAVEVETPLMYDFEHPALKSYLNRFPARQYTIQTPNKKVFMRFAACFGQFLIAKDATLSYRSLPLKLYELTRYSFRVEQHGELAGLRRLRAFTMPDCHCLCADLDQAKAEMRKRFELARETLTGAGLRLPDDLEFAIRITKDFWERNKDHVIALVKAWGKPALVEMWDERFFYFIMKYEWNFVDANDKASALATDQIDIENADRYGMAYMDRDNARKTPLILHLSPTGAIERVIYALLEKAGEDEARGVPPSLPVWLSPTQVRIIPVNIESHLGQAEKLAEELAKHHVRADIDDNNETIGKRIRTAEQEWVPYILVIGDKEAAGGPLTVRVRATGDQKPMTKEQLLKAIAVQTEGKPWRPLPLPRKLTERPIFRG
jgi:threonyl-tRNA synthetase